MTALRIAISTFVATTLVVVATGATTPALQATSVPLGNEVTFACRSDTPAVWVKQSPDLAHVVFLSHNGHPIDSSVDMERFAFSKVRFHENLGFHSGGTSQPYVFISGSDLI